MITKESQIERMKSLIDFGKKTPSQTNTGMLTPRVEHSYLAADGRTYGILRECNKFYIKVAPVKDEGVEILAEDYDYIDGFNNKKENEYSSYTAASKAFDLKMMGINEKFNHKQEITVTPTKPSEWQINETKEMRAEIDRINEINKNVGIIMKESKEDFTTKHTIPEAPASNPSDEKKHDPFVEPATAEGDKDFKETNTDPASAAAPFIYVVKDVQKDLSSDKKADKNTDAVYYKKAEFVPDNAITTQTPKGNKNDVKAVTENKGRTFKLTEEQVLAWNREQPDLIDTHKGTEIGSAAPFTIQVTNDDLKRDKKETEEVKESVAETAENTEKVNEATKPEPTKEPLNEDVFAVPFPDVFDDDYVGHDDEEDEIDIALLNPVDKKRAQEFKDILRKTKYQEPVDFDAIDVKRSRAYESKMNKRLDKVINEAMENYFGKHPAYRKRPMTIPKHNAPTPRWARDWDDESAKQDVPFGSEKGDTYPFTEVVDMLTDAVMKKLNFPKKSR